MLPLPSAGSTATAVARPDPTVILDTESAGVRGQRCGAQRRPGGSRGVVWQCGHSIRVKLRGAQRPLLHLLPVSSIAQGCRRLSGEYTSVPEPQFALTGKVAVRTSQRPILGVNSWTLTGSQDGPKCQAHYHANANVKGHSHLGRENRRTNDYHVLPGICSDG